MAHKFSKRSIRRMFRVHPALVAVPWLALSVSAVDFSIIEGPRTLKRQKRYVREGRSWTLNSRHLIGKEGVCYALDIVPWHEGALQWEDWELYHEIERAMKYAAGELGVPIRWGGDWKKRRDGPHWQLSRKAYPA